MGSFGSLFFYEEIIMELFDFAFISNYDDRFFNLAELADKESWDFSDSQKKTCAILKNYIQYTFKKLYDDKQIAYTADNKFACVNTGLTTPYYEDIYALFTEHHGLKSGKNCQPFYLLGFLKESDHKLAQHFSGVNLPKRANYFQKSEELVLNPLYEISANVEHIIKDNINRFPPFFQSLNTPAQNSMLLGAIGIAKKRAFANYNIAVPQYYNGKIQLLLPLYLSHSENPDLALALEQHEKCYIARTCLTMKMAYNNARLITKPQSTWLKP